MNAETEAKIEELRSKYGSLYVVDLGDDGILAFRRPTRLEFRGYKQNRQDDSKRVVADEILVKAVVVYPDPEAVEALMDRLPALATNLQGEILEAAGGIRLEVKKL